jgi:hypothetical protein
LGWEASGCLAKRPRLARAVKLAHDRAEAIHWRPSNREETTVNPSPTLIIGGSAAAVLVVGWLVVSFSEPSPRRTFVEWLSATAMYVALLTLFVHLVLRAVAEDSTLGQAAFGFLCVFFGGGLLVTVYRTVAALRGGSKTSSSATN